MTPIYHDGCCHDRPRDRFLGTVEGDGQRYDVYVYQDNALDEPPDMHVCMRYGDDGPEYLSPGEARWFVDRVETTRPRRLADMAPCAWPAHYVKAAALVRAWLEKGDPS